MKRWLWKYRYASIAVFVTLLTGYYFSLPEKLFHDPYSTVLEASSRDLLSASIAKDGQWRFPESDSVSSKFAAAIVAFEDKRFYNHPGVDILSLGRAIVQDVKAGKVVSGGSTITMQVIRLSRKNKPRSIFQKALELILATRLEWRHHKDEIISLYASHAPFGGNVVGLEAACWRYFGRDSRTLSWAEATMLAVLPNAPSLIHPGKNRELLKIKRDRLLDKLQKNGTIDAFTCQLAKEEPLPDAPHPLPRHARHLLARADRDGHPGEKILSTLDFPLQLRVEQVLQDHHQRLQANQIFNGAVLVLDVHSGNTLAYVGNIPEEKNADGNDVDVITAPRSTGSILKPFLYAAMLDEGKMLPKTLLPDIPVIINGFAPQNFSHEFDGAVTADKALIRSLNVPAVHMLKDYRYERFYNLLRQMGMTTLLKDPDHYGLSLILGGGECTLWDVTGMYASMARTLNNYFERPGKNRYRKSDFHAPTYVGKEESTKKWEETSWLNAASIFLTFETMKELYRPGEETGWRYFSSSKTIAWKTGTSFGFRDGWAVGVTPDYAVGVWIGNADGEGRPGLTGTDAAAPIMFDVFSLLPGHRWFDKPSPELQSIITCRKSGYRISDHCDEADTLWAPKQGLVTPPCPFHKKIHVSNDLKFRVHSACQSLSNMKHLSWFVLPPIQEYYFKSHHSYYRSLPPYRKDCLEASAVSGMDMIYPKADARIFIPREIDGKPGKSVFELAHRNPGNVVYWHMDGEFIGTTQKIHQLALHPELGRHTLTLVDETGESLVRQFEVLSGIR